MTTTNLTTVSREQAFQMRETKHNEATSLLRRIDEAQNAIEANQSAINKLNTNASYYKAVADFHMGEIEKGVALRNELVCKYESIMWTLYKASLPIFATTAVQEISVTLYSAQQIQA